MPRSRVRPEDRQRSSHACEICKSSKKRCDAQLPCASCTKKGLASLCAYSEGQRVRLPGNAQRISPAARHFESQPQAPSVPSTGASSLASVAQESLILDAQKPRMLLSTTGEQVFVGDTAAISFLQFLRKTLRRCAGPSSFTESQQRHTMLEAVVLADSFVPFKDDLEDQDKKTLVQHFQDATSGLLYLYTDEAISQLLAVAKSTEPTSNGSRLGAQCRGNDESDIRCAAKYFAQAQQIAFQDRLYDPSLIQIINFLLMAFYMLCACRRNTALMYLGVASQAATILGLHLPELDYALPSGLQNQRIRTYRSLRILDILCNAILGRPGSMPSLRKEEAPNVNAREPHHRMLALNATFDSCLNIAIISQTLIKHSSLDTDTAEQMLQTLRDWAKGLPEELRRTIKTGDMDGIQCEGRESTIGSIHVACSYYFGVILVTRQFLVATISPKSSREEPLQNNRQVNTPDGAAILSKTAQLSQVCIGAAKYLLQVCHDAGTADLLLGNMCILQAWVFAAGLVVGFSLLTPSHMSHGNDRVIFEYSRKILKSFSRLSPQAQRYNEILESFGDAIEAYRNQVHQNQCQTSYAYLEQIFKFEMSNHDTGYYPEVLPTPDTGTLRLDVDGEVTAVPPVDFLEDVLRPQPQTVALTPDVSDELGFQLLWDAFPSHCMDLRFASTEMFLQGPSQGLDSCL